MCRLLMVNKEGATMLESTIGVRRMLDHLVKQCGGHGNGLALIKDGNMTFVKKGVDYSTKKIAKKIIEGDYDYAAFHTRVASVGKVKDSNCHPYFSKKKDFLLMMNGTESAYSSMANNLGITDTELIFRIMAQNDISPNALEGMSSRFMGFYKGKAFISNSSYGGLQFIREKNAFAVASSFPAFVACEDMASGLWMQGEKIEKKKVTVTTTHTYGSYGSAWSGVKSLNAYKSDKDKEVQALRAMQEKDSEYCCNVNEDDYSNWEEYQLAMEMARA